MNFQDFNLHPQVVAGAKSAGYKIPTPIQKEGIPVIMQRRDMLGLAQTGTGKTAAFVLPLLHLLMTGGRGYVRGIVIAPTRELAEQINEAFRQLGRETRLKSMTMYGGVPINQQMKKIKRGVEIIVACPGRLLDHINHRTINLSKLEFLVMDEADQMFDLGFLPDLRSILQQLPSKRQNLLFSATMPNDIRTLANEILKDPVNIKIGETAPPVTVSHTLYPVAQHLKTPLLLELLHNTNTKSVLVFTKTKQRAIKLGEQLEHSGYSAVSLQGNMTQNRRQAALDGFRNGKFQILVATDIAARGIDVSHISHVVNYDIPDTAEAYIHRIGRTGRATRKGDAFTMITSSDKAMVRAIEKKLGTTMERCLLEGFDYKIPSPPKENGLQHQQRQKEQNKKNEAKPATATAVGKTLEKRSPKKSLQPTSPFAAASKRHSSSKTKKIRPESRAA